jgi:hypothetical protein
MKNSKILIVGLLFLIFDTTIVKSQITFPCNGIDYSNFSNQKGYYDLLLSHSFFSDNTSLPNQTYDAYTWSYFGNTYKLPAQPDSSHRYSAFGSLESGARLIESLLVMYETTHDKAYLHWATDLSVQWISRKGIGLGKAGYSERNSFGSINPNCN